MYPQLVAKQTFDHIPSVFLVRARSSHKADWQKLSKQDKQAGVALQFVLWAGECNRPDADLDRLIDALNRFISNLE